MNVQRGGNFLLESYVKVRWGENLNLLLSTGWEASALRPCGPKGAVAAAVNAPGLEQGVAAGPWRQGMGRIRQSYCTARIHEPDNGAKDQMKLSLI